MGSPVANLRPVSTLLPGAPRPGDRPAVAAVAAVARSEAFGTVRCEASGAVFAVLAVFALLMALVTLMSSVALTPLVVLTSLVGFVVLAGGGAVWTR
ncbi:hypothetical protein [Streptomyces sp. NPDC020965]|uniref:hypothetical protein n=1 Tax=Streptomyces sp. NPDC020965 TaxID=3365105 RepID=UPI0037AA15BE